MKTPYASAIILAGGAGTRMGRPKQMLPLNGKPVLARSIEAFLKAPAVKQIIVAAPPDITLKLVKKYKGVLFAPPGQTRVLSLQNALKLLSPKANLIAVHDGARPLVRPADITACLLSAQKNKAAVLAAPLKDTIKVARGGKVLKTLDRSVLHAAQTPQCYQTKVLLTALKKYGGKFKDATDESQLLDKLGVKVAIVPGGYANIKITTPEDLIIARALCK